MLELLMVIIVIGILMVCFSLDDNADVIAGYHSIGGKAGKAANNFVQFMG
ncbi:MAG: hypothetical protein PHQ52_03685 [Candidatus Omnitrophica bacterium]|nr:hypothetical protein [Candidatus Omnitrophota bacterium]